MIISLFKDCPLYIINRKIHGCLEIPDLFLVLNMISHSFAALTREISCSTLEINLVFPRTHVLFSIYYTSNSNCPIRKLSLCHVSMKLIAISRLTSSISEPAFLLTMFHPSSPGNMGWNIIRVDHARQHE